MEVKVRSDFVITAVVVRYFCHGKSIKNATLLFNPIVSTDL